LKKKQTTGILLTCAVVVITAAAMFTRQKTLEPLGPALSLPTSTPTIQTAALPAIETTKAAENPVNAADPVSPDLRQASPTAALPLPDPICGGPDEPVLILGVGSDSTTYEYGLADVIRIARLDYAHQSITVISLPRDLWVEIPFIYERYGDSHGKINQAYLFGSPGMGYMDLSDGSSNPAGGPMMLALAVQQNFGLRVDHYGTVKLDVFADMIDAIGGIDIDLPEAVDDAGENGSTGLFFTAGPHHFDGETAMLFARIRYKYTDFKRQDNQSLVLQAIRAKLLSPAVLPRLPALIDTFKDDVITDLSVDQLLQAACLVQSIGADQIVLSQLPKEIYSAGWEFSYTLNGMTNVVQADPAEVSKYLKMFAEGTWPENSE
jgi:LCP family protein required for cell wall assembly